MASLTPNRPGRGAARSPRAKSPRAKSPSPAKALDPKSPAAQRMAKYMVQLVDYEYINSFVSTLNKAEGEGGAEMPDWEKDLVSRTKVAVLANVDAHLKANSQSRQKFASMNEEDYLDGNGSFKLTEKPRPIIGYFPKGQVKAMDEVVLATYKAEIDVARESLESSLSTARASPADRASVAHLLDGSSYHIADVEAHRQASDLWVALAAAKAPIFERLAEREEFLDEVDDFETKATGDASRHKTGNSLQINDENKFRAYASKKLKELNAEAEALCKAFEEEQGRPLEVDGVNYLAIMKEQNFGRPDGKFSLARLPVHKITKAAKLKYNGIKGSSATPVKLEDLKLSLYEQGINTNKIITVDKVAEEIASLMIA